ELVYDLIFVYIVGRNNALMHNFENGFTTLGSFSAYVFCTLAIIQIWMFSTFYINLYGRNSVRDYVFLFTNMYLLYHMSTGISTNWTENSYRFCIAWALILLNIAVQHFIEARHHKAAPWELKQIYRRGGIILIEALLVAAITVFYAFTGISLTYIPVIFGIAATALSGRTNMLVPVDFGHLSERAMLYIVFTFGEMIIVISSYFDGKITPNSLYFSLMAFLIVVGLLLSYGVLYNRIIDRDKTTNGTLYMLIHVFLIFALNNISVALEFMRDEEVANFPKTLFLTGSFVLCFTFMFLLGFYAKKRCGFNRKFALVLTGMMISFAAFMLIFRENMYVNIAISAAYVFGVFAMLYYRGKRMEA
ncbi:MAG: low temperature requirement protein A, partial [Clostridia bacterium]|nr:low temperature requirement protein A [Clostridia bacterium]